MIPSPIQTGLQALGAKVIVVFSAVMFLLGGVVGATLTHKFMAGNAARSEVKTLRDALENQRAQINRDLQDFQTAATRMETIAKDYEEVRDAQLQFNSTLQNRINDYFKARPNLAACVLDADGLRLWNDANRGHAGPATSADHSGQSQTAMPPAAGRERSKLSELDAKPQASDGAVSRLLKAPRKPDERGQ